MSLVDSGYGWSVDSDYFVNTYNELLDITSGRSFKYRGTGAAIIVHAKTNRMAGPMLISTDINALKYDQGNASGVLASAYEYLGFTWYASSQTYWFYGSPASTGGITNGKPVVTLPVDAENSAKPEQVRAILEAVRPVLTAPSYSVAFDVNGGTGTMETQLIPVGVPTPLSLNSFTKEDATFIGWATYPTGRVVYTDGQTVENLAAEGETIVLYAVWQANPPKLILQYNKSDKEHLDKDIEDVHELDVIFKDECSIEDPAVLLEADPSFMVGVNYFTIPKFGRSYFLVNQRIIRTNLIEISGHVDVLSSFKDSIREQVAIIKRQETGSAYNLYINDNSLREYANPLVLTQLFPQGFNGFSFVMATAGVAGASPVQAPGDFTLSYEVASVGTQVTLNWTASANADSYLVMRKNPGGSVFNFWVTRATGVTALTYSESPIQLREFYYQVIALNNYGQTYSNIVQLQYQ